jgi:hypothetical protein
MRELRSCDFCGADAAGVYEVLPPELSPAEAEQRRVVLCADCLETLEFVVDPLLARLGIGESEASVTGDATPGGETAEKSAAQVEEADSENGEHGEDDEGHVRIDALESNDADAEEDSTAFEDDAEAGAVADARAGAEHEVADDTDIQADAESDDDRRDSSATGDSNSVGEEPPQFRKVMRLLGNREFPMDRDAVEALAAGAYDLDDDNVAAIIDHAVDRGVIVDEDGVLKKT